ncbi:hypothetical protein [Nonomuraea sp. NPDC049709]|uniref:hypothetical protein n=1 Tax=Nonomuraea sp. NPDC049709 TaxID=3154736 RepID=UPI003428F020
MHDPIEADRQEILTGPGDIHPASRNRPPRKRAKSNQKTILIAASALVAVLAAGGTGYLLASDSGQAAQQSGGRPAPSQSVAGEDLGGDDATMGDVTTDSPEDGLPTDAPDDGSMGDVADPGNGVSEPVDQGSTGSDSSDGTTRTGTGKKPATTSPTKSPQSAGDAPVDTPADGPAGEVSGQCSKSGC